MTTKKLKTQEINVKQIRPLFWPVFWIILFFPIGLSWTTCRMYENSKITGNRKPYDTVKIITIIVFMLTAAGYISAHLSPEKAQAAQAIAASVESQEISKDSYNKIKRGMSVVAVKQILGEPEMASESESRGIGKMQYMHFQRGFSMSGIDIIFNNGRLYSKTWVQL